MRYISLFLLFSIHAYALPELKTKQAIENLKYISPDGKITYYQNNSGELQLSFNYSFTNLMKSENRSNYILDVSSSQKLVSIELDSAPHSLNILEKKNQIFVAKYGDKTNPKKVAEGINSKLQLEDQWLSFYDLKNKEINLLNIKDATLKKNIQLNNRVNDYFIPKTKMLTVNHVLYTDLNTEGYEAVLIYSILDKKFQSIYKTKNNGNTLNYCVLNEDIYIYEFPHLNQNNSSQITKIGLYNNPNYTKSEIIYSNELNDLGSMICEKNKITIIKTTQFQKEINLRYTDIAEIDLLTKKTSIKTDLKYITQILSFGGMIIANQNAKYYIYKNNEKLNTDEIIKQEKNIE